MRGWKFHPTPTALVPWVISLTLFGAGFVSITTPPFTPAQLCSVAEDLSPLKPGEMEVSLSASAPNKECWRAWVAPAAAAMVKGGAIRARPTALATSAQYVYAQFEQAAVRGQAPDIAMGSGEEMFAAARAGYIVPLDGCIESHIEFRNVHTGVLSLARKDGHVWGVPISVGFTALFFNKAMLRQLDWSPQRIAALPKDIRTGEWTLEDLLATAREAVRRGVVDPGFGFWPGTNNSFALAMMYRAYGGHLSATSLSTGERLSFNRAAWQNTLRAYRALYANHITDDAFKGKYEDTWNRRMPLRDAYAAGRVLFWVGDASEWGNFALDKVAARGGQAYLFENLGFALFPASRRGGNPNARFAGSYYYFIASDRATGGRGHQQAACALLSKMMTPELNDLYIARSGDASMLLSQAREDARFGHENQYMLEYSWNDWYNAGFWTFIKTLNEFAIRSEGGDEPVETLAEMTAEHLRTVFGSDIIIE